MTKEEIKKELLKGEDMEDRFYLSNKIEDVLNKSYEGEIGLADFLEDITTIIKEGKDFMNN